MTNFTISISNDVEGKLCSWCKRTAAFKIRRHFFCRTHVGEALDEALLRREEYCAELRARLAVEREILPTPEPSK